MSTSDPLIAEFERLLDRFPGTFTLEQWQFAYKKVIFSMGLKILEKFPRNALGPDPTVESSGGEGQGGGGQGGGGQAGAGAGGQPITKSPSKGRGPFIAGGWPGSGQGPIIHIAIAALELAPPPPP